MAAPFTLIYQFVGKEPFPVMTLTLLKHSPAIPTTTASVPAIYLAAPYSHPDPVENTNAAIRIADALLDAGFAPLIPHLNLTWHLVSPKSYETWLYYDRQLICRCDALLRVPGFSLGADQEVEFAMEQGLPVIHPRSAQPTDCVRALAGWFDR